MGKLDSTCVQPHHAVVGDVPEPQLAVQRPRQEVLVVHREVAAQVVTNSEKKELKPGNHISVSRVGSPNQGASSCDPFRKANFETRKPHLSFKGWRVG